MENLEQEITDLYSKLRDATNAIINSNTQEEHDIAVTIYRELTEQIDHKMGNVHSIVEEHFQS